MTILKFCEEHGLDRRMAYRFLGRGDYVIKSGNPHITEQGVKKLKEKFNLRKKRKKKTDTQIPFTGNITF